MTSFISNAAGRTGVKRIISTTQRRTFREVSDDLNQLSKKRLSPTDINRRIYEREFSCFPPTQQLGFTANQVDVNRPGEDRWSAYRIGGAMVHDCGFYTTNHPLSSFGERFSGGNLFTVVDGHAGHTCAHAVNLLHADYVVSMLMPDDLLGETFDFLSRRFEEKSPLYSTELAQPYWSDSSAVVPTMSEDWHSTGLNDISHYGTSGAWKVWGPWGSLNSCVNIKRQEHLMQIITERLSLGNTETDSDDDGDLCDAYGHIIAPADELVHHDPSGLSTYDEDGRSGTDPEILPVDIGKPTIRESVAFNSSGLRSGLDRLDKDITAAAAPCPHTGLDKSLLRIVLSGCVTTSVYLPSQCDEVYIAQVGDCSAVLGSYKGELAVDTPGHAPPLRSRAVFSPSDWTSKLLVRPHTVHNEEDVRRLCSQHPIHETDYLTRYDRLLGELMPLRAFGDIRYKWTTRELKHVARLLGMPPNYPVCPSFYHSPPYLIATPQVVRKRLDVNRDRFIILASDGLWDMLTPQEAVNVAAQHWVDYQGTPSHAGPGDSAASRLIRTALGGENMDTLRISALLSIPDNIARYYRDDITVLVIYPQDV